MLLGDFQDSISHFMQAETLPVSVISLFPNFIPNPLMLLHSSHIALAMHQLAVSSSRKSNVMLCYVMLCNVMYCIGMEWKGMGRNGMYSTEMYSFYADECLVLHIVNVHYILITLTSIIMMQVNYTM